MDTSSHSELDTSDLNRLDGERNTEPLFRSDMRYEILDSIVPGNPVILIPREYQEIAQSVLAKGPPVQLFQLAGTRRLYAGIPIFDIRGINKDLKEPRDNSVGFFQAVRADAASLQDLPIPSNARPGDAILVAYREGRVFAFVVGPGRERSKAGIIVYGAEEQDPENRRVEENSFLSLAKSAIRTIRLIIDSVLFKRWRPKSEVETLSALSEDLEQSPLKIEITPDEIRSSDESLVISSPEAGESTLPLLFPKPVPCAYRGHVFTQLAELCPSCGVPVCRKCRDEARGCITVGCPNSICR